MITKVWGDTLPVDGKCQKNGNPFLLATLFRDRLLVFAYIRSMAALQGLMTMKVILRSFWLISLRCCLRNHRLHLTCSLSSSRA